MNETIRLDLYKGKDPGDVPTYYLSEAAHHLRLPVGTVRSWVRGRGQASNARRRASGALVEIVDFERSLLSFRNLVELHVLSSLRRFHKVKLREVRRAIEYLKKESGSEHPLLCRELFTDGKNIFIEMYSHYISVSQSGQMAMKGVMSAYLKRIVWDIKTGVPIRLFPFTRADYEKSPRVVAIDPKIRFGDPCIAGTRIPTSIVAERHRAGDSMNLLAEDYGRPESEIEEAIRYESRKAS